MAGDARPIEHHLDSLLQAPCGLGFVDQIGARTFRTSADVIVSTGRAPMTGNTSLTSDWSHCALCFGLRNVSRPLRRRAGTTQSPRLAPGALQFARKTYRLILTEACCCNGIAGTAGGVATTTLTHSESLSL